MRTRNNRIHFYLTDEEYISFESKVKIAGCSREEFLRNLINECYNANTAFAVEVFSDKVTIYSPGSFPIGFTPEDFANNSAEPFMLNPKIVNVLFKASIIESFGSGYERTFSACAKSNVKYGYENTKTGFKFIFYRPLGHQNVQEMTKSEELVYICLKECDYLTISQIATGIKKSGKTVYRAIKRLKEKGYIGREGNDAVGYWKILK